MFDAEVLMAPLIIFMIIVAPLWLILHYRSKKQVSQGLSEHEHRQLIELANKAEKMAERVETLEALLDQESPQWRRKL
ncbi:envelope stress response membrane protein PspB [Pseudoalteromonas sp. McH1-7]|uniref:Phage shock protein B n=1 Tax=Pseudoalteromonas peptidolytica F12-50-A1 TaxID=1315280 RepID=A0A8I0MUW8_9GAMM|nr:MULTISPECIES: envelope stress response membrane protein PspB [Pseudoalteromonas]MBE0345822.1 phage shock protein B [Pseudoalteromonas peptidolytica F12-50-A1]MDW7547907.1 envelope stress response membrane protein PspB [Pseudoalteromonas peptidolytica]NLR17126.1 envelope stress response membrane protein PspB [Pseudoalteromonas peptidolytica]NUZ11101.1 envelope stress response membrane protein PspB [Pseudoalteromonas sp. McH1-7]RRS07451.1 envelope stress response membrane protein PspB [Pseudo